MKSVNGSIRYAQVALDLFCIFYFILFEHYYQSHFFLVKVGLKNTSVCTTFDYLMGQI